MKLLSSLGCWGSLVTATWRGLARRWQTGDHGENAIGSNWRGGHLQAAAVAKKHDIAAASVVDFNYDSMVARSRHGDGLHQLAAFLKAGEHLHERIDLCASAAAEEVRQGGAAVGIAAITLAHSSAIKRVSSGWPGE